MQQTKDKQSNQPHPPQRSYHNTRPDSPNITISQTRNKTNIKKNVTSSQKVTKRNKQHKNHALERSVGKTIARFLNLYRYHNFILGNVLCLLRRHLRSVRKKKMFFVSFLQLDSGLTISNATPKIVKIFIQGTNPGHRHQKQIYSSILRYYRSHLFNVHVIVGLEGLIMELYNNILYINQGTIFPTRLQLPHPPPSPPPRHTPV